VTGVASFTVEQGKRYRATIVLGWIEGLASNELIASKLAAAGFTEVRVSGSGGRRQAEAVWPNADRSGELPPQIAEIAEVGEA
jgi:hypothetical protein